MGEFLVDATNLLTIAEAADVLGVKPWQVVRLIESKRLEVVELIDAASLRPHMKEER